MRKVTAAHIYTGPSIPNRKKDPGPSTGQPGPNTLGPRINNFNNLPYRKTLTLQSVLTRKYLKLLCQVYPANSRVLDDRPLASVQGPPMEIGQYRGNTGPQRPGPYSMK